MPPHAVVAAAAASFFHSDGFAGWLAGWRAARVGCRARRPLAEEEGCCEWMGRSRRDSFRTTHATCWILVARDGVVAVVLIGGGERGCLPDLVPIEVFWDVIWFLSFAVVLFCDCFFFCWTTSGDTAQIRGEKGGFRTISVCLGNRAGLIVDAMLDPVSQQPYRVFFSWSWRQAGQPARLTSIDPSSARLWHHSRGDGEKQVEGDIIRPQRPVSRDSYLHLVGASGGRDFCQCRHEKSRPDAVNDCPRRGHLFSVNMQPYLASPFPVVWFETSIHHVPQRSSPTGGPSEQQETPPGWRTARQKPLPPRKHGMGHS